EGTLELALDGGLVAVELFEGGEIGQAVALVQARVLRAWASAKDLLGAGDVTGLGADDATQTPATNGDVLDASLLDGALGMEVIGEGLEEVGEVLGVLIEEGGALQSSDERAGADAVLEGVQGDAGFALGGLGAGRTLGVTAVGVELGRGGHFRFPPSIYSWL
ncbi:MAG: hypothetical protein HY675_26715, partial [Chloroflexi bacterium]|nr:hypothetical protein [Chloroflexota bacterium]